MSYSTRYAESRKNEPIAVAGPIVRLQKDMPNVVREVRCGTPCVISTRTSTVSFSVGKRDTLIAVVCGHNRRQVIVMKSRKPFTAQDVLELVRNTWQSVNLVPKNLATSYGQMIQ